MFEKKIRKIDLFCPLFSIAKFFFLFLCKIVVNYHRGYLNKQNAPNLIQIGSVDPEIN